MKSHASSCQIKKVWLLFVPLFLFLIFIAFDVSAQPSPLLTNIQPKQDEAAKNAIPKLDIPVGEQLVAVKARLADARQKLSVIGGVIQQHVGATSEEADEYKSLWERLIQSYELQNRALEQMQVIGAATDDLRQQMASWSGFGEAPPYPLELGDDLWREIRNKEQDNRALHMALLIFENDLADSKERLKPATLAMQQSAEQLNQIQPDENAARPRWLLELNQLRLRVAEVEVATHEMERRMMSSRIAEKELENDFLARKLDEADAHIHFSQQELSEKIIKLDQERLVIQKEIMQAKQDDEPVYLEHTRAQERLDRLKAGSKDTTSMGSGSEIIRLEQLVNLLNVRTEASTMRRRALLEMERTFDRIQAIWKERFVLMNKPNAVTLKGSLNSLQTEQDRYKQQRDILLSIQAAIQTKLVYEQSRSKDPSLSAADREQSRKLAEAYRQQIDTWIPLQTRLASFGDLLERTLQEAERRKASLSLTERTRNLFAIVADAATQLTDFEIYSVTDTITVEGEEISGTHRVTLGQILLFLLIITAGFWISTHAVRLSQRTVRYLFKLSTDSTALFARLAHMILALAVVVAALTTMKIPVTVFAFLGGAMALAIGFGAQNLLNNFVSGLILLIERPVKTGDIVDVEGVTGRITQVGARCCQIRRMDGVEMLVPNSAMIEKTVTNWTLSDQKRRASVTIGITYDSPVEQTQTLIEAVTRAHPDVLTNPGPLVLFEDFGASALMFTVYYWLDLAHVADRMLVASEIRVSLNQRLPEAGIVIAHPQRDVYLHNTQPFEVVIANPVTSEPDVGSSV
ncbi:MAG: mechanosensitive ion channel [Methylococcaceae bacterium]|nr:mechanosensitive ion channel [Methylococcaceae bacterium]